MEWKPFERETFEREFFFLIPMSTFSDAEFPEGKICIQLLFWKGLKYQLRNCHLIWFIIYL